MGVDVVVNMDDLRRSSSGKFICRICLEEESESCKSLEAPCACSGTVKFAHRDCVQRWCDEKGNTICELCLQKFEPGYTSTPNKVHLIDTTMVTIRGSLEIPRMSPEQEDIGEILETESSECASAADRSAACFRSVALILTALLLIRHLCAAFAVGAGSGNYPLSLPTLLVAKASGIILPMYVLLRVISTIHNSIRHHHQQRYISNVLSSDDEAEYGSEGQHIYVDSQA